MKKVITKLQFMVMSIVFMILLSTGVNAQTKKISLQGFLKDANGKAVSDGDQALTFKIYTVASGGTAIWSEDQTLKVFGGVYSAQLGSITDISVLAWDVPYFVGVTIQGTELSPRTELTYAPYSFGTNKAQEAVKAQEVVCSGAVGDVKYSILNPTQFAAVNGTCWVPMDGRSIAGSKLAAIMGVTTITNAGGLFLRGQEFAGQAANHDPDRTSITTIATMEDQAMQTHQHGVNINTSTNGDHSHSTTLGIHTVNGGGFNLGNLQGTDRSTDWNIPYNTNTTGNHSHNVSGNTSTNDGYSAQETRPKNLNLWTYIRIN